MGGAAAAAGCYGEWGAKESRGFHPLRTPPPPYAGIPQELGTAQRPFRPGLLLLSPLPVA